MHTTGLLRRVAAGGAILALIGMGAVTGAGTAYAVDITPSCGGVVQGNGEGPLTKSFVSITPGANPGDYTVVYRLDSARPPGDYRIRDCAFIDTGAAGYSGEAFIGSVDEKGSAFTATPDGSTALFTQTVSGVGAGDRLCDRAAVSGSQAGTGFTDKSNTVCITPDNPPVVPEAPFALALPLAAAGALGLVVWLRRRSDDSSVPAATA